MRWVNACPECGEEHPELGDEVGIRTASHVRQPSEAALDAVRSGEAPLPTRELNFTAQFTPAKNRPLTEEEKRRG